MSKQAKVLPTEQEILEALKQYDFKAINKFRKQLINSQATLDEAQSNLLDMLTERWQER